MALYINTNVSSLNAQRNLNMNSSGLSKTLGRLSSGLRINSAADDAAGLAISTSMESQIRGLNQAARNAGDGLSMLRTAETAISEQTSLLQRMRELAVQAASDTNSDANRAALNDEVSQLKDEFDRIAQTTKFNGQSLLDGSFTAKDIQVGADSDVNQKLSVALDSTRSNKIGENYTATSTGAVSGALADAEVKITVDGTTYNVGASASDGISTNNDDASAIAHANAINAVSGQTGVTAEALATSVTGNATAATGSGGAETLAQNDIKINGVDVVGASGISYAADTTADVKGADLVARINAVSDQTGVTASFGADDKFTLTAEDGRNIQIELANDAATITDLTAATTASTVKLTSYKGNFSVTDGDGDLNIAGSGTKGSDTVSTLSVATKDNAKSAIDMVDGALTQLNDQRASIGAKVNRLNSVSNSLTAASENMAASRSQIMDADFASETASMSRNQILQQAAVSVLAQANQVPQLALSLLR